MSKAYRDNRVFLFAASIAVFAGLALAGRTFYLNNCPKADVFIESKINPNTATEAELMMLSGIGPSKANAIIQYRESRQNSDRAFEDINDLQNVSGIGPKTVENLTPFLQVD